MAADVASLLPASLPLSGNIYVLDFVLDKDPLVLGKLVLIVCLKGFPQC